MRRCTQTKRCPLSAAMPSPRREPVVSARRRSDHGTRQISMTVLSPNLTAMASAYFGLERNLIPKHQLNDNFTSGTTQTSSTTLTLKHRLRCPALCKLPRSAALPTIQSVSQEILRLLEAKHPELGNYADTQMHSPDGPRQALLKTQS